MGTIIRFSVLLARGIKDAEKVFGTYNIGVIIFFNALPRKKRFTNSVIGFFGILGPCMRLRIIAFCCPDQKIRSLPYLASNTIAMSSVVATDLHRYIGDEWLLNFSQTMTIVSCDIKHIYDIFPVVRIAFAFALVYLIRKNR